jgi:murein DD-endopeptidase MepM/ murein hydrolase activator NlpD
VSKVQDLWIYGEAAQQTLYQRALNSKGLELIRRFLKKGFVTVDDIATVDKLYPTEGEPLWQGRNPTLTASLVPAAQRQPQIQVELWQLSVAHAMQGVVDFLTQAVQPVQQQGITAGAVFFPDGNQVIRQGFDSRLQPWDRFPNSIEWHPMVYGICGNSSCIVSQLQRVLSYAPPGTKVIPALAGNWGQSVKNRPPLEVQMEDIHRIAPQVNAVSHFAYSWQEPEFDRDRQFCHLK